MQTGIDPCSAGPREALSNAAAGGLVAVEVWESRDAQAASFGSRLHTPLESAGITPPPKVTWVSLAGFHVPAG